MHLKLNNINNKLANFMIIDLILAMVHKYSLIVRSLTTSDYFIREHIQCVACLYFAVC